MKKFYRRKKHDSPKGKFRDIKEYIVKALRFFDLKNEYLTPVIFSFIMIISFIDVIVMGRDQTITVLRVIITIIRIALLLIANAIYLSACIKDAKGIKYTFADCFNEVAKEAHLILLSSIVITLAVVFGLICLVFPGIYLFTLLVFTKCYIVDKGITFHEATNASKDLAKGNFVNISISYIFIYSVVFLVSLLFYSIIYYFVENSLFIWVQTFFLSLVILMHHRLSALIYVSLEYDLD